MKLKLFFASLIFFLAAAGLQPPPPLPGRAFQPPFPPGYCPHYGPAPYQPVFCPPNPSVTLDQQLRLTLVAAGITPLDPGPDPDPALVDLGRLLYFDKELSGNRDISCATCHHPYMASGDTLSLPVGTGGKGLGYMRVRGEGREFIPRNAPEVFNRGAPGWTSMFWDSRVSGSAETGFASPAQDALPEGLDSVLAVQAMFPVTSREEMRGQTGDKDILGHPNELATLAENDFPAIWSALMARLTNIPEYVSLFQAAYPEVPVAEFGFQHAANAIAAFEIEAYTFTDSPWDRYVAGADEAISNEAKRGALLFYGKAQCAQCHSGNLFTDQAHHNLAVPQLGPGKGAEAPFDYGRGRETLDPADLFAFRTPPLRNVALTGPWMHNGAYSSLTAAVSHHFTDPAELMARYDINQLHPDLQDTVQTGEVPVAVLVGTRDPLLQGLPALADLEMEQMLAFLQALTSPSTGYAIHDIPHQVPSGLPVAD
ncbi:MAG TPA: cytochrome c peroxidase [Anaerolineae bacterium]|nr:cytochrome c peroxidase [Anaerolineae bacterium]